jgi:hypothetical protein
MRASMLASTLVLAACGGVQPDVARGGPAGDPPAGPPPAAQPAGGVATDELASTLRFMREEEKLAHDVYAVLGARWGLVTFSNIQASEARHTEAVRGLLVSYGVEDPAAGRAAGEFVDPALAGLYTALVAEGSASVEAALNVGAQIEDLDLVDLAVRGEGVPSDVATVFGQLSRGSRNHLRAFVGQLDARGVTFTPTHLSAEDYTAIISTPTERGGH